MASSEAVKRRVRHAKAEMEAYSAKLFAQQTAWRAAQRSKGVADLFPSTQAEGRGAVSPLGNVSPDWEWSGRKPS
jgi:hypothetical protein